MTDDAKSGGRRTEDGERIDDAELLRRYAEEKSEDAFAALVRRHIDFVYAAALRQARGNAALAQDVTQTVFTDLARKAAALARHEVVVGWLHTATRFAATKAIRTESRRYAREQEAYAMNEVLHESGAPVEWERLHTVLDEVLGELKERERAAILLRFFEKKPLAEVGAQLSLTETAARSCVDRALEKMRARLEKRGVTSTSVALAIVLTNQVAATAPAGLVASVTGAALAGGGAVAAGASGGGAAVVTLMGMTKLQIGMVGAIAVAGATGVIMQAESNSRLRTELAMLQVRSGQLAALQTENGRLAREAAEANELRRDAAALTRLQEEAAALKTKLEAAMRTPAANRPAAARPAVSLGQVFDITSLDQKPTPEVQARPQYPAEMRRTGVGGEVVVDFVVDPEGNVQNAHAVRASRPEFETSAVEAVSKWKFKPGQKTGQTVSTHMQIPIVFTVSSDRPKGENWF